MLMRNSTVLPVVLFLVLAVPRSSCADSSTPSPAPQPRQAESATDEPSARRSPKAGWGDFQVVEEKGEFPIWAKILLWLPNRLLDAVDMVHFDVGVGPAAGAVVRITKWGQFGYRDQLPESLRIGNFGRTWPVMMERSTESGIGPYFESSKERTICPGEVGAGADVLIVGLQAGICVDEVVDFIGGIFFLDPKSDDLE